MELAIVDFRKKYHDSVLGYAWSMLNPLLRFAIYQFVFTYLFVHKVHKYTLYILTGVFFYNFFQDATASAMSAVRIKSRLTKKIYFPRYFIVVASNLTAVFSFIINTFLLFAIVAIFDHVSWLQVLTIIPFVLLMLLASGVSFIIATLFIHFKDISQIWTIILTLGFWLTPIMYDPYKVGEPLSSVALYNPVGRILVILRAYLVYDNTPTFIFMAITTILCVLIFLFGLWVFRKYEHRIPEYV